MVFIRLRTKDYNMIPGFLQQFDTMGIRSGEDNG